MSNTGKHLLLVYPDYIAEDSAQRYGGGNYSEGLASISAVLKENGHRVSLMHLRWKPGKKEFLEKLAAFEHLDLVGFSVRTTAFVDVREFVPWVKEANPNLFVFCGSYHCTLVPDEVLAADGVDAVCIGEGEYPLRDLLSKMRDGVDFTDTESFYFKLADGTVKKNPVMPMLENLDELPIPDYNLFDYKNLDSMRVNTALVMLSRGCLFSCTYCGNSQFRNVYPNKKHYARFRSPENAMKCIETLLSLYPQIEYFNFRDAIFNMYPEWFDEFIDLYRERVHLPFTCNLRFDVLTEDTVRRMSEAGCYLIDIGVESGNPEIRTKYLKRFMTDEEMINASAWLKKYHIRTLTYNILGLPYEDLKSALMTVKLNAKLHADKMIPNIFYPYPMTVLHDIAKDAGFVPDVIPPKCRVPLRQKQFPKHEVLFAACYFQHYVKCYKRAAKMKHGRKAYERWLEFWFTGPITPRRFFVFCSDCKRAVVSGGKRFVMNRMPKLYLKLRKLKHR